MVNELVALRRFVATFEKKRDAAAALGISHPYLSDLLHGHRRITDALLEKIGYRRHVTVKAIRKVS